MEWADGIKRMSFELIHPSDNTIDWSGAPDIHQPHQMCTKAVNHHDLMQRNPRMFPTLYSLDFTRQTVRTHGLWTDTHQRWRNEKQINKCWNKLQKRFVWVDFVGLLCLSLMEVRAAEATFDENEKKKMHRKEVTVRKTDTTRSRRMKGCHVEATQREPAPNVICMCFKRLDGRWSTWLCEFILFILPSRFIYSCFATYLLRMTYCGPVSSPSPNVM